MKRTSFVSSLMLLPIFKLFGRSNGFVAKECKTQRDAEGPYYKAGAPLKTVIETEGEVLTITGTIFQSTDCTTPVSNAIVDIWHCDSSDNFTAILRIQTKAYTL